MPRRKTINISKTTLLLLAIFSSARPECSKERFKRNVAFDGQKYTGPFLWIFDHFSLPECAQECFHDPSCTGFQFSKMGAQCVGVRGFDGIATSTTPSEGYQLFEKKARPGVTCVDDSSCQPVANSHCHQQACRCDIGYDRNQDTCRNLTECDVYGDSFAPFPNMGVWGHDLEIFPSMALEDCGQICVDTPGCKSADSSELGCYLQQYSWYEFPDGRDNRTGEVVYLQRQCMTWLP